MSAGDVLFVGWTGGDPLYKELRPAIEYEPILQAGRSAEDNLDIEKRITRNLLCFEKDRDSVLSIITNTTSSLKSVYVDTDGSVKENDFGAGWNLLSVSEAPQAIGFIRISATYSKVVSKALDIGLPTLFNVYSPSAGILQIRKGTNVLEQFDFDKSIPPILFFNTGYSFIDRIEEFQTTSNGYVVIDKNFDKSQEYAFAELGIGERNTGNNIFVEKISFTFEEAINTRIATKGISPVYLDEVIVLRNSHDVTGYESSVFSNEIWNASIKNIQQNARIFQNNDPDNIYFPYEGQTEPAGEFKLARLKAESSILSDTLIQPLIDEWQSQDKNNIAIARTFTGTASVNYLGKYGAVPVYLQMLWKMKKDEIDLLPYRDIRFLNIAWYTEVNKHYIRFIGKNWKEYDSTGLT